MATKRKGYTTTADMPADVQEHFELTEDLEGGPVFDLPKYRQTGIDFSQITLHTAETLVKRNWPGIRRREVPAAKQAAPAPEPAQEAPAEPVADVRGVKGAKV